MTLALVALAVLAVVIFAFVLEPVLRARSDQAVLDAAALPEHEQQVDGEDDATGSDRDESTPAIDHEERLSGSRVSIERPVGSDAS